MVEKYTLPNFRKRAKPLNVLVWSSKAHFDQTMHRVLWNVAEVLAMHPSVTRLEYAGPGFCGYDEKLSPAQNIARMFPGVTFAFAFLEYVVAGIDRPESKDLNTLPMPLFAMFHECPKLAKCDEMIVKSNVSAGSVFPSDKFLACCRQLLPGRSFVAAPQIMTTPIQRFTGDATSRRSVDILLTGNLLPIYPLRRRIAHLMMKGKLKGSILPRKTTNEDYNRALRGAKIVIATSGFTRWPLKKVSEAACAGALVIGDLPDQMTEMVSQIMVPIDYEMSDEQIIATIYDWLQNEDKRVAFATKAQRFCQKHFSSERFVDLVLDTVEDLNAGRFGLARPFSDRIGCKALYSTSFFDFAPSDLCAPGSQMRKAFSSENIVKLPREWDTFV